jgi:elongation factor 1 alpha-like protein
MKSSSAEVQITLRANSPLGPASSARAIPLESYAVNKAMGRILIRREGETIAAGSYTSALKYSLWFDQR